MDFFEYPANTRMHLWPYDFVSYKITTNYLGPAVSHRLGPLLKHMPLVLQDLLLSKLKVQTIRGAFVQFGTFVYENPYNTTSEFQNVSNSFSLLSPLTLVYFVYIIIIDVTTCRDCSCNTIQEEKNLSRKQNIHKDYQDSL